MELEVACYREADELCPEGACRIEVAKIRGAGALEAFVDRHGEGWAISHWMSEVLDAPTEAPVMVITAEDAEEPARPASQRIAELVTLVFVGGATLLFFAAGIAGFAYAVWTLVR